MKRDLRELAKQYLILDEGLGELNLIRRIQLAEGGFDCFATSRTWTCSDFACKWRKECLVNAAEEALSDH